MEGTKNLVGEPDASKNSIELLHETKPTQDLSIKGCPKTELELSTTQPIIQNVESIKIETVFQPSNINKEKSSIMVAAMKGLQNEDLKTADEELTIAARPEEQISSKLYSVSGSVSARISRRDVGSKVFPVGCMGCKDVVESNSKIAIDSDGRPASAVQGRNPLTGSGMENPDIRRTSSKKKDGNPLLGTGYDEEVVTQSKSRIPPGGFSQGLW